MTARRWTFGAAGLLAMVLSVAAIAQPARHTDADLENRFRADVAAVSPEAAVAFEQANAAREANRLGEAVDGYRKAIELAPKIDHPHRRLCSVLGRQGQHDEAVREC